MATSGAIEPSASSMNKKPIHVSVVVFPECDPSIIYGVFDTLWAAGRDFDGPPDAPALFEPRLVSSEDGPIKLITGVSILPQDTVDDLRRTDVVFVPNVMVTKPEHLRALDRKLLGWIRQMHLEGSPVCTSRRSTCSVVPGNCSRNSGA